MSSEVKAILIYVEVKGIKAIIEVLNIVEELGLEISSMQFYRYEGTYSLLLTIEYNVGILKFIKVASRVRGVKQVKPLAELPTVYLKPILSVTLKRMVEVFNDAAKVFMYHVGLVIGRVLKEILPALPDEEVIERALLLIGGSGLGKGILTRYSSHNHCVIKMRDSFECIGLKSKRPASYFFRGVMSGLLGELWKAEVIASEVKCIARGDGYCEFLVIPSRKEH